MAKFRFNPKCNHLNELINLMPKKLENELVDDAVKDHIKRFV